jgi:signal recognition particle subunit SRP54
LLDADVNFKLPRILPIGEKALGQNVLTLQPGQLLVKLVKDELTELMGGDVAGINLSGDTISYFDVRVCKVLGKQLFWKTS